MIILDYYDRVNCFSVMSNMWRIGRGSMAPMTRFYFSVLVSFLFCLLTVNSSYGLETEEEYFTLPAFKMLALPEGWFDTTPVYKEPHLLVLHTGIHLYLQYLS